MEFAITFKPDMRPERIVHLTKQAEHNDFRYAWIFGGEQKTLRLVAQHADWWNLPGGDLATYAHKLAVLREHCQAVGRNYDDIVKTWSAEAIVVAETEAEAARIAATSPFKNNTVFGTPSRVAEQLQAYVDLGVTYFIPRFVDFPNTVGAELFAQEVMPLLG